MTTLTKKTTGVEDRDYCPVHGGDAKNSYTFGRYGDAEVVVYQGCQCASTFVNNGFNDPGVCYPTYAAASGAATLAKSQAGW